MDKIFKKIAEELNIGETQVESAVKLIDDGNTIPFIARYRKEVTGNLSDEVLRELDERLKYLRNLESRKEEIIRLIDEQGKLTDELTIKIASTTILSELFIDLLNRKKELEQQLLKRKVWNLCQ